MRSAQHGKGDYLIVHRYAPELNTLIRRGVGFRCAGCTTIKQARAKLFAPSPSGRYVKVVWTYPERFLVGSQSRQGLIPLGENAYRQVKQLKEKLCYPRTEPLLNGEYLPFPDFKVTTKLIG